ncbi:MAG: preprotein translocase subunit YajC [Actinomycetota bacterium]|nr:preprotein translocase subunit YajC [Actinomycetota bacterium]
MPALLPLLLLIPLWFLLVRPQQRRVRAQQALVRSLRAGDDVLTSAGIYGSIVDLDDEVVTLEVADGVRLRVARMAVGRRLSAHEDELSGGGAADTPIESDTDHTILRPPPDEQ